MTTLDRIRERNILQHVLAIDRDTANKLADGLTYDDLAYIRKISRRHAGDPALLTAFLADRMLVDFLQQYEGGPRDVFLLRAVTPANYRSGPFQGQAALQVAIIEAQARGRLPWLTVGRTPVFHSMVWAWAWLENRVIHAWHETGRPFCVGPNVLFANGGRPGSTKLERTVLTSPHCRLIFTESEWYADLIRENLGPDSRAEIVIFPYPIFPPPAGPDDDDPRYDLLVFNKHSDGADGRVIKHLCDTFPRHVVFKYGKFKRAELIAAARSARAAVYFSRTDRGPLALAEILLSGCPAVGRPRGAPWLRNPALGIQVNGDANWDAAELVGAVHELHTFDRLAVRRAAAAFWDPRRIVETIETALDRARKKTE